MSGSTCLNSSRLTVAKFQPATIKKTQDPEKQRLVNEFIKQFQPQTAADVQDILKEMFAPVLQGMLEGEMDDHLGYKKYQRTAEEAQEPGSNSRNGHSPKTVTTSY